MPSDLSLVSESDYNCCMTRALTIIYTTSSGHTEFVIDSVIDLLTKERKELRITKQRAELTKPEDLTKGDLLLLACGTWNTGNVEGQLQPYMHDLLMNKAAAIELKGMPAAAIGLGDERYHFTAKAAERLNDFLQSHGANVLLPALKIINEPFDQQKKIDAWAKEFSLAISKLPTTANK